MRRRHWIAVTVVLLVAIVFGILLPAISRVRETAARMKCNGQFCLLAVTLHNYASSDGTESFPRGTIPKPDLPPEKRLSWMVSIVPYLDANNLYREFDLTVAADQGRNQAAAQFRWPYFVCPASGEYESTRTGGIWKSPTPLTHYVGVAGVGNDAAVLEVNHSRAGVFGYDRRTSIKDGIPDGLSNSLLVIETSREPGHWAFGGPATVRGVEPDTSPYIGPGRPFGGFHSNGWSWREKRYNLTIAALADGSRRTISDSIAPEVLEALATVSGKEQLPADW
jgi:hypothetical protein